MNYYELARHRRAGTASEAASETCSHPLVQLACKRARVCPALVGCTDVRSFRNRCHGTAWECESVFAAFYVHRQCLLYSQPSLRRAFLLRWRTTSSPMQYVSYKYGYWTSYGDRAASLRLRLIPHLYPLPHPCRTCVKLRKQSAAGRLFNSSHRA